MAYELGKIGLHARVKVQIEEGKKVVTEDSPTPKIGAGRVIETTVGRCIFNDILPSGVGMPFYNMTMAQKKLSGVISDCFEFAGSAETVDLLDRIKDLGFKYATP